MSKERLYDKNLRNVLSVAIVSVISYTLQVLWIILIEPLMADGGVSFGGIIGTGDIISAVFIYAINVLAVIVLALIFKGDIPIGVCGIYNLLYFVFLLIYSPGRLYYSDVNNIAVSALIISGALLLVEVIPFIICRICMRKNR